MYYSLRSKMKKEKYTQLTLSTIDNVFNTVYITPSSDCYFTKKVFRFFYFFKSEV